MTLSQVMQGWRARHGLSEREAALRLALPLATVRGLEGGVLLPTAPQVSVLAHGLGLPVNQVLEHVRASAAAMVEEALDPAAPRALAARHLETDAEGDALLVLPGPVQAAIEAQGETVEAALARVRALPPGKAEGMGLVRGWRCPVGRRRGVASRGLTASAELAAFCAADRTLLLYQAGAPSGTVPALWLDTVITEVMGMVLDSRPLRGKYLGVCDYERRSIFVNSRMQQVALPNTYLEGLRHSTKAHELGHLRFSHHALEVRQCHGENGPRRGAKETLRVREFEADYYAGVFLVPSEALAQEPEAQRLAEAAAAGQTMTSDELWAAAVTMGRRYQVTGGLLATRLSNLGLVVKEERTLRLPTP